MWKSCKSLVIPCVFSFSLLSPKICGKYYFSFVFFYRKKGKKRKKEEEKEEEEDNCGKFCGKLFEAKRNPSSDLDGESSLSSYVVGKISGK